MRLVEQHSIKKGDPRYEKIDQTAFASKNLWNAANYVVRQSFIHEGIYLDNVKVFHQVKSHEAYQGLPCKVGNQVLIQLHKALPPVMSAYTPCARGSSFAGSGADTGAFGFSSPESAISLPFNQTTVVIEAMYNDDHCCNYRN